jgi:farnesyl diphosphate synthase
MSATAESAEISRDPQFQALLERWQSRIERELAARLPPANARPTRLHEALRYSALGGGKRVRPVLVYATANALGIGDANVDGVACAVELIHAYSLVHDDLPAMDDDDLRRGRPTCHKAFDEATAILVGDALQVLAFETLASGPGLPADATIRLELVRLLAVASGTDGMAGGQALDLAAVGRQLSLAEVEEMHARKTGALIHASVLMAAACAERTTCSTSKATWHCSARRPEPTAPTVSRRIHRASVSTRLAGACMNCTRRHWRRSRFSARVQRRSRASRTGWCSESTERFTVD